MFYRFMTFKELAKVTSGMTLSKNKKYKARTASTGYCFMSTADNSPEEAFKFLSGIVSEDVVVLFEAHQQLKESCGMYATPYGDWYDTMVVREYCTNSYSRETMIPVKYGIIDKWGKIDWYNWN